MYVDALFWFRRFCTPHSFKSFPLESVIWTVRSRNRGMPVEERCFEWKVVKANVGNGEIEL